MEGATISPDEYMEQVRGACITVLELTKEVKPLETKKSAAQKDHQKKDVERDEWLAKLAEARENGSDAVELLDELSALTTAVMTSEKKADTAKSKWQSKKSELDNAHSSLNEVAMAAVDTQLRLRLEDSPEPSAPPAKEKSEKPRSAKDPKKKKAESVV